MFIKKKTISKIQVLKHSWYDSSSISITESLPWPYTILNYFSKYVNGHVNSNRNLDQNNTTASNRMFLIYLTLFDSTLYVRGEQHVRVYVFNIFVGVFMLVVVKTQPVLTTPSPFQNAAITITRMEPSALEQTGLTGQTQCFFHQ